MASAAQMLDITGKAPTVRTAVAQAQVHLNAEARQGIAAGSLRKGRPEQVARVAGVMAAKRCPDLIPYCHPIGLNMVEVDVSATDYGLLIRARCRTEASTGVEMEALTAVTVAALTVFDMCKSVDPGASIQEVRVLSKQGGKTGDWGEPIEE